jgi:hypothetical protein
MATRRTSRCGCSPRWPYKVATIVRLSAPASLRAWSTPCSLCRPPMVGGSTSALTSMYQFTFLVRSLQSAFHGVFVSDGGCYYCVFWLLQIVGFRQVLGAAAGQVSAIQNRGQRRPSTAKGRGPMSTCFSTAWC